MNGGTLVTPGERDVGALVDSFDHLVAGAKSFFPGRVLLNRKKARNLLDRLFAKLLDEAGSDGPARPSTTRALEAVEALDVLAALGGYGGPSIWRIWFVDVRRKRLSEMAEELREALTPFMN
jgi:hypothetical protein